MRPLRILLITYSYTPDLTPRAFRWAAVVERLVAMGHEVHVLCASGSSEPDPSGPVIHRVADMLFNASARVSAAGGQAPPSAAPGRSIRSAFRSAARWLRRSLLWPDYACGWLLPATRAARKLQLQHPFDWVISTSHPFSGHLVALWSRRGLRSERWLVDISDPYSGLKAASPYNRLLYARLSFLAERSVIERASAVTVTTDATAQLYNEEFSGSRGKTTVVPPLLSLAPAPPRNRPSSDGILKLVFVGTLYRRLRNPKFLIACFSQVMDSVPGRRLELHFYGSVNDCSEELSSCPEAARSSMFVHGLVPRSVVHEAMADADVLVNIGNDEEAQLASKVVEYMAAGRPVLNIVSVSKDMSVEALAGHPAVLTLRRTEDPPSRATIESLAHFLSNLPEVPQEYADRVRERYSSASITGQYLAVLSQAIPSPRATG